MFFLLYRYTDYGVWRNISGIKEKNLISVRSSISSLVRMWKIRHSSPGCRFVWISISWFTLVGLINLRLFCIFPFIHNWGIVYYSFPFIYFAVLVCWWNWAFNKLHTENILESYSFLPACLPHSITISTYDELLAK